MTTRALAAWLVLSAGGWPGALLAGADADDYAEPLRRAPAQLSLTSSQEQAVGIRVEQPLALRSAPQIEAYGTVLDPVALANDMGRVETTRVAAAAAQAEATRLEHLYRDDAQVSLKASQAAQAQSAEASAQARAAALGFSLQWGPLASWSALRARSGPAPASRCGCRPPRRRGCWCRPRHWSMRKRAPTSIAVTARVAPPAFTMRRCRCGRCRGWGVRGWSRDSRPRIRS